MIECYKTINGRVLPIPTMESGCWINIVHPTSEELERVVKWTGVEHDFIYAPLDPEESSRVEIEEDQVMMIVDIPTIEKEKESEEAPVRFANAPSSAAESSLFHGVWERMKRWFGDIR